MRALLAVLWIAACLPACGAAEPGVASAPVPRPAASAAAAPGVSAALGSHVLRRSAIRQVVADGLGMFLQHVDLDDHAVKVEGKFRGFRIVALRGDALWAGVDLKPGDVVTGVNGFPIERPDQAATAFDSLQVASELRVAYDRDGAARELVYSIVDDR